MKKSKYLSFILIFMFFISLPYMADANYKGNEKDKGKKPTTLQKPNANPSQSLMNINGASCWVTEEGFHDWVVQSGWNGAFPIGSTVGAIFAEGVVWGGLVDDGSTPLVRVNGNTYGTGCAPVTRLYRVRSDLKNEKADFTMDAATFNDVSTADVTPAQIQSIKDQYLIDWNEWPVGEGAPYNDVDGNGVYDPTVDIPGIPGASQTLFIKYNDDLSESNYGSAPIGMEISETYWAYAVSGALNNVIFKKIDMIYTGTSTSASNSKIDSMYIVQWADPDVGNSTDDFAGCDTTLDLGYAYSSKFSDGTYAGLSLAPPAVGYDFLQGVSEFTGNPDDSAMFNLQWRKGYKYVNRKPMSSYVYFAAGGAWSDPSFNYNGTLEFYNLMRGRKPIPRYPSGELFEDDVADYSADGCYLLAGDPVFGNGKLDGNVEGPGDRRIMVTNGPISMSLGDTAQVVVALVYGLGKNNLASISYLKYFDSFAQYAYDQLFNVPIMPIPDISSVELDNQISISWSNDEETKNSIENSAHGPFDFQGYTVYQLPYGSVDITQGVRVANFDVVDNISVITDKVLDENTGLIYTKPIVFLENTNGIQRHLALEKDYINNKPLINGQAYTFAVTAFGFNNDPGLPTFILESKPAIVNVTPQMSKPGERLSSNVGDTVVVTHNGGSDGSVFPIVIDPSATNGHTYKVTFDSDGLWTLTDETAGTIKLEGMSNQSGDEDYHIVDGLLIKVIGPAVQVNSYRFVPSASRWFTGYSGLGGEAFFGGLTIGSNFFGSNITPDQYVTVEVRFVTDRNNGQKAYRYLRGGTPNYSYQDYENQYFTVWDVDANPPRQISAAYVEQNGNASANSTWEPTANSADREYLFILNSDYSETPEDYYTTRSALGDAEEFPTLYGLWPLQRGSMPFNPQDGQVFTIIPNYANTTNDVFTFTAPAAKSSSSELAKKDIEMINVFPNPYYGYHYRETSPTSHYVTFSHLPANSVIRIFDISGVLVKTINHPAEKGQFDTWDLQNDNNYPVASGIYIVHVDMPDLGKVKILKLAVIQEQQILKVY